MKRLLIVISLVAVTAVFASTATPAQAAANTAPIDASYNSKIIDDSIFTRASLSAADIQAFLNSKVPTCRTGYTCLKDYRDPVTGKSAAQLIFDVSRDTGLNPQVILVTLQKEQSLVTDDYPYESQYRSAMGYGCFESEAECRADYWGFYNQVRLGSTLLKAGHDRNCGITGSFPGWSFGAQWRIGSTPSVDGRPTPIGSCATGALYGYTPHRPDSAWLPVNGTYYYGNYNFVTTFERWFGSTRADSYHAQYAGQSASPDMPPGAEQLRYIDYRNTGTATWTKDRVRLGTANPLDRGSGFANGWLSANRVAMDQDSVAPGQVARFSFWIKANPPPGVYPEYFRPLVEGVAWMEDYGVHFPLRVTAPQYAASFVDQTVPAEVPAGSQPTVTLRYRNIGNTAWSRDGANAIKLGTEAPRDHASTLQTASWQSANRISMQEPTVPPGAVGTFRFQLNVGSPGVREESFTPLIENVTWLSDTRRVTTESVGTYVAEWAGQSFVPPTAAGEMTAVWIQYKNTGSATWYKNGVHPVRLGTDRPQDHASSMVAGGLAPNRPAAMDQDEVPPGGTARFQFNLRSPGAGIFTEYYRPVSEGRTWFGPPNTVYVELPSILRHAAAYHAHSVPEQFLVGQPGQAWIEFKNTGTSIWRKTGSAPFRLGTNRPLDRLSTVAGADWLAPNRIALDQESVAPGQVGRFTFTMNPGSVGTLNEHFRPLIEGVSWLEDYGVYLPLRVGS